MSGPAILALLRQAPFAFVGTVEQLGAATMEVPVDDRTAVVRVDRVLYGPDALAGFGGQRITLQLAVDAPPPAVGDTAAFFAQGLAFGDSVAVAEVGRLPVAEVEVQVRAAGDAAAGARAVDAPAHAPVDGESAAPLAALVRRADAIRLADHADGAAAVVVARVIKLEQAPSDGAARVTEHDPDWWVATMLVQHVERGAVGPGDLRVLYANSLDLRWREAPKPKASESGVWLLHRPDPALGAPAALAPFVLLHAEDRQPATALDAVRARGR